MKNLEFHVDRPDGTTAIETNFNKAAGLAISLACVNGDPVNIDVVAWSRSAAKAWSGDDGVESYDDDPDTSVFDRIVVRAESIGRIA
jgi:hypothetical protein